MKSFSQYVKEVISPYHSDPQSRDSISDSDKQELSDIITGRERSGLEKSLDKHMRKPGNSVIREQPPPEDSQKTPIINPDDVKPLPSPQMGRMPK
jgi:hypothetical protein